MRRSASFLARSGSIQAASVRRKREREREGGDASSDSDGPAPKYQRLATVAQEVPVRSDTVCQERSMTMHQRLDDLVEETEDTIATSMINDLLTSTEASQHIVATPPSSPQRLPSLSRIAGHAAEAIVTPVLPKAFSSKQMLHKGYENQASTWNAAGSLHGMVRRGDFEGLKHALAHSPQSFMAKDDLGANILHVALLINGAKQRQIACWLLDNYPALLADAYDSEGFAGEVALHFPIVHRDPALARLILGRYPQALLSRAKGSFFREPKEGCYFGEYPLLFAVCTNQPDLVATFLEVGVRSLGLSKSDHLQYRDLDKNTALHLCVHHNLPEMYDFIEELWKKHCPTMIENGTEELFNKDGYTPFTLAAKLGRQKIFYHLLQRCSITEWKYGPINCRKVTLTELDRPLSHDGVRRKGVLQILEEEEHSHLLMHPLILQLQQYKWDTFAGRYFMNRVCVVAAFIELFFVASVLGTNDVASTMHDNSYYAVSTLLSLAAGVIAYYLVRSACSCLPVGARPERPAKLWILFATSMTTYCYFVPTVASYAEWLVVGGAIWKACREFQEMLSDSVSNYFSCKGAQLMENIISLQFSFLILVAVMSRYYGNGLAEDLSLAAASLTLWSYVLWLLLGFRVTGPFVIMIWQMMRSDMIRFLLIFVAFLFGFAQTFFILLGEAGLESFVNRVHVCFVALLGQAELSHEEAAKFPIISTGLLLVYVILVSVLLLNLLVAMMSSTYSEIEAKAEKVWRLQWTRLIFSIESEMSQHDRMMERNTYWKMMESPTGPKRFFVLPMKADEEEVQRFHDDVTPFRERRAPAVWGADQEEASELAELLEDPSVDAAYGDVYGKAFQQAYADNVNQELIKAAVRVFNKGDADRDLVQLLVGITLTPQGSDILGLLSHHYYGYPIPKNLAKVRASRFLAALLHAQHIPTPEVRAIISSFTTHAPLSIEATPSFSSFPAQRVNSLSLPTEATS